MKIWEHMEKSSKLSATNREQISGSQEVIFHSTPSLRNAQVPLFGPKIVAKWGYVISIIMIRYDRGLSKDRRTTARILILMGNIRSQSPKDPEVSDARQTLRDSYSHTPLQKPHRMHCNMFTASASPHHLFHPSLHYILFFPFIAVDEESGGRRQGI